MAGAEGVFKNSKGTWDMKTGVQLNDPSAKMGDFSFVPEATMECATPQRRPVKELIEEGVRRGKFRFTY